MRILHIDETFHPSFGYQCNPLAKFQQREGNEVFIIAPEAPYIYKVYHSFGEYGENLDKEDAYYTKDTGVQIIRVPAKGWIMERLNYDMPKLYDAIKQVKPDSIMVHCAETLTAIRVLRHLNREYPMIIDSHMLSMASQNKLSWLFDFAYRLLCTSIIKRQGIRIIKTQNDDYVTTHLGVPDYLTRFISFGTDTVLFHPNEDAKNVFLAEKGLPKESFVIVSTGKLNAQKNGKLFASAVKDKFANRRVVVIVVANFVSEYEMQVKHELENGSNEVFFFPVQRYLDLPWFYQIADVTVFPKQCSMSFYDAQSCASPVISEKGHVNEERNSHGNGLCFECGSVDDLRCKIQTLIDMQPNEYKKMRQNSLKYSSCFSYDIIASEYTEELEEARRKFKNQ